MTPRPFQIEAMDALDSHLRNHADNPCIVLPTGSGKTPTMAWTIQRYLQAWPAFRVCVLAHRKELLRQGVEKMHAIWPMAPVGIYSAGLGAKDKHFPVTYAGIQSIYRHACAFDPWDMIFIDEAHRIPLEQDGQYRQFIRDAQLCNPRLRVVGWTATPYRLGGGMICHRDYVLNRVIYEANVKHLIDDGFLCPLRTKLGNRDIDAAGVKKSKGEFDAKQLEQRATAAGVVDGIAAEAVAILNREGRKSILFFCVTIEHAEQFSAALAGLGLDAPAIHSKTDSRRRDQLTHDLAAGRIRALTNVDVLSEGFDAQRIDAVVLVRPTASQGLYYQQVGRGLRMHPDKQDCLVLDFAGNVARHGPIDVLAGTAPEMIKCGGEGKCPPQACQEYFAKLAGRCPACGWKVPPPPPPEETVMGEGSERLIPSDPRARSEAGILSDGGPWEMLVEDVAVKIHAKPGKPDSLQVTYMGPGGIESHREWICLGRDDYGGHKARQWWRARFGDPVPTSAAEAMAGNLFLAAAIAGCTEAIRVRHSGGKYTQVMGARLRGTTAVAAGK